MGLTRFERFQLWLLRHTICGRVRWSVSRRWRWEWGAHREFWTRYTIGPIFVLVQHCQPSGASGRR